jgi:hypothetical protein
MTEREIMSRRAAIGLLRAHASRAEEGSQLQRDLIIASDIISDADVEIEGLIEERKTGIGISFEREGRGESVVLPLLVGHHSSVERALVGR